MNLTETYFKYHYNMSVKT